MTLTIQAKDVYGTRKYYPDCEQSRLLAQVAGTRTLTRSTLRIAEKMGYEIIVRQEQVSLV